MKKVATKNETKKILDKYDFLFKKKFGQNFLIDQNILTNIVKAADIKDQNVVEIGPGIGALTQFIADDAKKVYCFEIDQTLKPILEETLLEYPNTEVIFQDILQSNLSEYEFAKTPFSVVANLPYYITTPIIEHLIPYRKQIESITIMMQKEVAERIQAKPGNKQYGSLSIYLQTYFDVNIAFIVPKTVFMPAPDVDSAILRLVPKTNISMNSDIIVHFEKLIRVAFATRRKTILNNLQRAYDKELVLRCLELAEVPTNMRPEQITIEAYQRLAELLMTEQK